MQLKYIENDDFILLKTDETLNREIIEKLIRACVECAEEHNCNRILMDHRDCKVDADIVEIFEIAKNIMKFGVTFRHRGAVVYNIDDDKYRFADNVINNSSGGVIKFFNDFEIAKGWLLEQKK